MLNTIKHYMHQSIYLTKNLAYLIYKKCKERAAQSERVAIEYCLDKKQLNQSLNYFIQERQKGILNPEWEHYLSLYDEIIKANPNQALNFCPQQGPLARLKLSVNHQGILEISPSKTKPIQYTQMEAYQVAKAIYQLAYAYTQNPNQNETRALYKGIGFFLMRPFAKLYPTQEVLTLLNLYRDLEFSYRRRILIQNNHPNITSYQKYCAIVIQRQFRKHQSAQKERHIEAISPRLKESMEQHRISSTPQVPKALALPSKQKQQEWIRKQHNPELYEKVINNLVYYRSHAKFLKRLQGCARDFNTLLSSLPADLQDYAIIVPNSHYNKSNHWVTGLVLEYLEKKPQVILYPSEINSYKATHPNLKHLVFFDDAIYSGRQMAAVIDSTQKNTHHISLVLPFYNKYALFKAHQANYYILGERMLCADEIESNYLTPKTWQREDTRLLNSSFSSSWAPAASKVGVFFQHKTADDASTFLSDLHGMMPNRRYEHIY